MRKVLICNLTPDMCLAKPVLFKNMLLLNKGIYNLNKYIKLLEKLGIYSIYIEDGISSEIEIPELVSEKTLLKCRNILQNVMDTFKQTGSLETDQLYDSSFEILEELLSREDILVSLDNIGSTDTNTLSHSLNVTIYALLLGIALGYSKKRLQLLAEGAILHDIGKTLLDQKILFKPGKLTNSEFDHIKNHAFLGYNILKENPYMSAVTKNVVLYHHERLNGTGYPDGIRQNSIHAFARIVAIADVYDAVTMDRCYRKALSSNEAIAILKADAGDKLDSVFVETFICQLAIYPNGSLVRLADRRIGIIKEQNRHLPFQPIIRILYETDGSKVEPYEIDLSQDLTVKIINEPVIL
jgi:putative nucleotidyltransferase with HDIG domain